MRDLRDSLAVYKQQFGGGMPPFDSAYFGALNAGSSRAEATRAGGHALLDAFAQFARSIDDRLNEATEIIRACDSPDGWCGEMPDDLRERIEAFLAAPHDCGDPTCPGRDGDPCHYEDHDGTPAFHRKENQDD